METLAVIESIAPVPVTPKLFPAAVTGELPAGRSPMIGGIHKKIVKAGIWINIFLRSLLLFKSPKRALIALRKLRNLKDRVRENHVILKYAKVNGRYYYTFNAPGWPSLAFNRYILNNLRKADAANPAPILDTILFGITKKCGYQCEHCFEWEALNKPETLSREDLLSVIRSFQKTGVTQVHLSGGEPLNRFDDIIHVLRNIHKGTEVWLYTSGYHFTEERASILKREGLTGITVSLDHCIPDLHNIFRGKKDAFQWAQTAVANARMQGLVVCLSLCATKEFISTHHLRQYAELARQWGVAFIQLVEPKAVGHFAGKDVALRPEHVDALEHFYLRYNYEEAYVDYPAIVYHEFYARRVGCSGGARHYVYIDTDGDVHNCPFCQRKIFSALQQPLEKNLELMLRSGCSVFNHSPQTVA